jgi:hypothetical protein
VCIKKYDGPSFWRMLLKSEIAKKFGVYLLKAVLYQNFVAKFGGPPWLSFGSGSLVFTSHVMNKKIVAPSFQPIAPRFSKEHCLLAGSQVSPVRLVSAPCLCRWVWSIGGMILTGERRSTGRGTCHSDTLCTKSIHRHGIEPGLARRKADH